MYYKHEYDKPVNYELPAPGEVRVRIVDAEQKKSQSGNEMIELKMSVTGGTGNECPLYDYIVDNSEKPEQASSKTGSILRSCGKEPTKDFALEPELFVGLDGVVMVGHEEYNGKTKAKVKWWVTPMSEDSIPF